MSDEIIQVILPPPIVLQVEETSPPGQVTSVIEVEVPGSRGADGGAVIPFSASDEISVRSGKGRYYVDRAYVIAYVAVSLGVPATGSQVVVDILKNGVSLWVDPDERPTLQPDEMVVFSSPDTTSVGFMDYFTVSVAEVGSSYPGAWLTVQVFLTAI